MKDVIKESVAEWMSQEIVTVRPEATIAQLIELLESHAIHGAPVVDKKGKLQGVISMTDVVISEVNTLKKSGFYFVGRLEPVKKPGVDELMHRQVRDLMNPKVFSLPPSATLGEAAEMLVANGIQRVVISDGDHLEGILSVTDILAAMVTFKRFNDEA